MSHTIPDDYVFNCVLYKKIEAISYGTYGSISNEALYKTIIRLQAAEENQIIADLYTQILQKLTIVHSRKTCIL